MSACKVNIGEERQTAYEDFLLTKVRVAEKCGIDVNIHEMHKDSKPHQKAIALWALQKRVIELYSNKGDMVGDPFGGLCTTGCEAIELGRKAYITELNEEYARCGNVYMSERELKVITPTLFDSLFMEQQTA